MAASLIEECLRRVDQLVAEKGSYEEVVATLNECAQMPGADQYMPGIGQRRLGAVAVYERSEAEREKELVAFLRIEQPLAYRSSSVLAACASARSKRLAEKYVLPLLEELREALAAGADDAAVLEKELRAAQNICARLGVPVDGAIARS